MHSDAPEEKVEVIHSGPDTGPELKHRKIQELYARVRGYFWLPCPLCGRYFGGHEWNDIGELSSTIYPDPENPGHGKGICPVCTAQGKGQRPFSSPKKDVPFLFEVEQVLRRSGREYLNLQKGEYWDSGLVEAQARAVVDYLKAR